MTPVGVSDLPGLHGVENLISSVTEAGNETTRMMLQKILPGGKRLRPVMVLLAASFYPHDEKEAEYTAAATELIHAASLVHDDVIDLAATRRGDSSVNKAWGNHAAVLLGDYLFAEAFRLLANCRSPIVKAMTRTIQVMCEGEIDQLTQSRNPATTEEQYFSRIGKKTASLIAASCQLGGLVAGLDEGKLEALREYGLEVGLAFQIVDDLLDFVSTEAAVGKPVGHDIANGTLTLPLLHLLKQSRQPLKLWQDLTKDEEEGGKLMLELMSRSGSLEYSWVQAVEKIDKACGCLDRMPAGRSQEMLRDLAFQVLARPELKKFGLPEKAAEEVQPLGLHPPIPHDFVNNGDESLLLHLGV